MTRDRFSTLTTVAAFPRSWGQNPGAGPLNPIYDRRSDLWGGVMGTFGRAKSTGKADSLNNRITNLTTARDSVNSGGKEGHPKGAKPRTSN